MIENDFPGFVVGSKEKKLGLRASGTFEIVFQDCEVPRANLLGTEGGGFRTFMKTLEAGRISIGAFSLGIAQAAMEASIKFGKERKQFDTPITEFQATQMKIADMATEIHAARLLIHDAARRKDAGEDFGRYRLDVQVVRFRDGDACHQPGHPDPRRIRVHPGVSGRAFLSRRPSWVRSAKGRAKSSASSSRAACCSDQ